MPSDRQFGRGAGRPRPHRAGGQSMARAFVHCDAFSRASDCSIMTRANASAISTPPRRASTAASLRSPPKRRRRQGHVRGRRKARPCARRGAGPRPRSGIHRTRAGRSVGGARLPGGAQQDHRQPGGARAARRRLPWRRRWFPCAPFWPGRRAAGRSGGDPRGAERILIAFDNLDALPPAEALHLIETAHSLLGLSFVAALACDAAGLAPVAASGGSLRGRLDKLFQLTFNARLAGAANGAQLIGRLIDADGAPRPAAPAIEAGKIAAVRAVERRRGQAARRALAFGGRHAARRQALPQRLSPRAGRQGVKAPRWR